MIKTRFAPSPTGLRFSLEHLGRAPARFDASQLDHWQRQLHRPQHPGRSKTRLRVSGKALFLPLRAALTGRIGGPDRADLIALMPRERVRERFAALIKKP